MRTLSFQDWILAVLAVVTIAFIAHVWGALDPAPSVSVVNTNARQLQSDQWAVSFVLRNRGEAPASRLRVRMLAANAGAPDRLQAVDDFILANELDPAGDMIRIFVTPRPAEPPKPAAAPAAAAPAAPAAGRGAAAAPPPPPPPPPAPAREPQSYVLVLQADYPAGAFGSTQKRRWYYFYHEGDLAAVQVGEAMRQRVVQAADALLP